MTLERGALGVIALAAGAELRVAELHRTRRQASTAARPCWRRACFWTIRKSMNLLSQDTAWWRPCFVGCDGESPPNGRNPHGQGLNTCLTLAVLGGDVGRPELHLHSQMYTPPSVPAEDRRHYAGWCCDRAGAQHHGGCGSGVLGRRVRGHAPAGTLAAADAGSHVLAGPRNRQPGGNGRHRPLACVCGAPRSPETVRCHDSWSCMSI